jgi:uncharacterized protein YecT (DUF1311 family)
MRSEVMSERKDRFLEQRMITCKHMVGAVSLAIALLAATACDSGSPSKTSDDIAADSALAADLALANRDTLLVDSIGEYRPADAAERDPDSLLLSGDSVTLRDVTPSTTAPSAPAPSPSAPKSTPPASTTRPAPPVSTAPSRPAPSNPAPAATKPAAPATPAASNTPRVTGARACNVPGQANQSECVKVTLASTDQRLNRIYRALITEMRRQEGTPGGAKDPPSVQRLRVAQRAWLVYRDTECRRRGRGKEGALWARPRVKCLGEFSVRRANELADNFSRLTAH